MVPSLPGFTRLHRYYEPLRIPTAPGLSLAGVRLIIPSPPLSRDAKDTDQLADASATAL